MKIIRYRLAALLVISAVTWLVFPQRSVAADFNVRHYGATGDGKTDDRQAFQRAVDAAIASGKPSKIIVPAGRYLLGKEGAQENGQLQIAHAHSLSVIGAHGTVLISAAPQSNIFMVLDSTDIHIHQFVLDRDPLLFTQGIVNRVDIANKTASLTIDPHYDSLNAPNIAPQKWLIVYSNPDSGTWGDHSSACAFNKPGDPLACWPPSIMARRQLGTRDWEVTLNTAPQENYVGHRFVIWSGTYKGRAFLIRHSKDVFIEDVVYYGGGADGFVVDHSRGKISFRRFTIGTPPGSDRLLTATGGGMVFNNHADLILNHVDISHNWDDALNIGANFARVYQQLNPTTIQVDGSRADFVTGDLLSVWDWTRKKEVARSKIVGLECDSKSICLITLDHPVTVAHPDYAPVKSTGNDTDGIDRVIDLDGVGTLHITDSKFQSLHARCLLIKASNSSVERSICHDTVMAGFLVGPQFYWDEGPEVHDLAIRKNEFLNVSGANILVTNGGSANAPSIAGLTLTNNNFINYDRYQHGVDVRAGAAILLQNTTSPSIGANKFSTKYKSECCGASIEQFDSNFAIK
jgi:hypothetical protein